MPHPHSFLGITTLQTFIYFKKYPDDGPFLKCFVRVQSLCQRERVPDVLDVVVGCNSMVRRVQAQWFSAVCASSCP